MRKWTWLLAAIGGAALVSVAAVQAVGASVGPAQSTVLKFETMAPVTGPYVGTASPIRGVPGGGFPWMIKSGTGSLRKDGHLFVAVHGLVLANDQAVPAGLRGTNPIPDFRAIVSCQSIGDGSTATVANVATGQFPASQEGDAIIRARVHLPRPCIAPVVFVASPGGAWFAASGG